MATGIRARWYRKPVEKTYRRDQAVAWAAGLFEGEGFISATEKTARVGIHMTDRDILERFREAVGCGTVYGPYDRGSNRKPMFQWNAGSKSASDQTLRLLFPFFGPRRQAAALRYIERERFRRPMHRLVLGGLCRNGHEVTADSLYVAPKSGGKLCKTCRRAGLA